MVQYNTTRYLYFFSTVSCGVGCKLYIYISQKSVGRPEFKLRAKEERVVPCVTLERARNLRGAQWPPPPPPRNSPPPYSRLSRCSGSQVQSHRVHLHRTQTIFTRCRTTHPWPQSQTILSILNHPFPRPPPVLLLGPPRTRQRQMALCQSVVHLPRPAGYCNLPPSAVHKRSNRPRPCLRQVL